MRALQGVGAGQGMDDRKAITVPVIREGEGSFGDALGKALNDVSAQQDKAADTLGAFLRGEPVLSSSVIIQNDLKVDTNGDGKFDQTAIPTAVAFDRKVGP